MNDLINEITQRIHHGLNSQLDEMIIERLAEAGHVFETREELESFASSDRCLIVKKQIKNGSFDCTLIVDGIPIGLWNDEVKVFQKEGKIIGIMND